MKFRERGYWYMSENNDTLLTRARHQKALPEIDKYLSECEKEFGNCGD